MARAAPAPADIIIIDRPDPPTSIVAPNQNLRTTIPLKRNGDVNQQPLRRPGRLEPIALLGAAAADAARPAGAPTSRARVGAETMVNCFIGIDFIGNKALDPVARVWAAI